MYQMLTGKKPFQRDSLLATLRAIDCETPSTPVSLRDDIPTALSDLVMQLLEKEPAQRPASAAELIRRLDSIESTAATPQVQPAARKVPPRRRMMIATAAAAAVLLLLAGVIVKVFDKDGNVIATIEGDRVEITEKGKSPETAVPPMKQPNSPDVATDKVGEYLSPMSPVALVQRPAKLVSKEGEAAESWTIATVRPIAAPSRNSAISLRPDGKFLAAFHDDGLIRIWDVETKRLSRVLAGHGAGPSLCDDVSGYSRNNSRRFGTLAWHPSLPLIASASRDGSLRVWDSDHGKTVFQHNGVADGKNIVAWSPDGTKLAAGYQIEALVRIWTTSEWKPLKAVEWKPYAMVWSPDSSTLAIAANEVLLWFPESETFKLLEGSIGQIAPRPSQFGITGVRWSEDGRYLAHWEKNSVVVRDAKTLEKLCAIESIPVYQCPGDFAFAPDGGQLAVIRKGDQANHIIAIHNVMTGKEVRTMSVHVNAGVQYLEWLPNGQTLAIDYSIVDLNGQVISDGQYADEASRDGRLLAGRLPSGLGVWEHRFN